MGAPTPATAEQQARAERLLAELIARTGLGRGPHQLRVDDVRIVKGQTTSLIAVGVYHEIGGDGRRRSIAVGADPGADGWDQFGDAEVMALLARDAAAFLDGHHWQRLIGLGLRAAAALGALFAVAAVLFGDRRGLTLPLIGFAVLAATQLVTAALSRGLDLQSDRRGAMMTGDPEALARCYRRLAEAHPDTAGGVLLRLLGTWRRVAVGRAAVEQRLAHLSPGAGPG